MFECQCEVCRNACRHKPGWFAPGEAEAAAKLMNLTLKEFFDKYLVVDYWIRKHHGKEDIFVLSPNIVNQSPGDMMGFDPEGQCVFYQDGLCSIHAAKPLECAQMSCKTNDDQNIEKEINTKNWDQPEHRSQIENLLGCKPESPEPSVSDVINYFFKQLGGT